MARILPAPENQTSLEMGIPYRVRPEAPWYYRAGDGCQLEAIDTPDRLSLIATEERPTTPVLIYALTPATSFPGANARLTGGRKEDQCNELTSLIAAVEQLIANKTAVAAPEWQIQKRGNMVVCETADQYRTLAKFLVKMVGRDDARLLKQQHLQELRTLLDTLPRSFGKSPKDFERPFEDTLKIAKETGKKIGRLAGTINRWMTQLHCFLSFVDGRVKLDVDLNKIKNFRMADLVADEEKRQAFEDFELKILFSNKKWAGPVVVHDSLYWAPLLGRYAFGRLSEVVGLLLEDIDTDPVSPAIEFRDNELRKVKTKYASERRVPLHPELIRLGFLNFVAALIARGERLLFPELAARGANTALSALFDKIWVPILDEMLPHARAETKTYHSFRKAGNTPMINIHVPDALRYDLIGHKQKGTNARHYKGKIHDAVKLEAMAFVTIVTGHLKPYPIRLSPLLIAA